VPLRLFIALDPPDELRRSLAALSAALRRAAGDASGRVRWGGPDQLHLTLRFLGEVPEADLDGVAGAVRGAAGAGRPLALEVRGAGAFPSPRRARVLWLGLGGEVGPLGTLVADLGARLEQAGFPPEARPFVPHLTLGRSRGPRGAAGLSAALDRASAGPALAWRAGALTLFRSHLGPGGARHEPLLVAPLGGGPGPGSLDRGPPDR
jgi:2'-5' RNA ligase